MPRPTPQVPWRALRSPVVVELADVHLRVALRRDAECEEGPAGERAWLAKQAELAAAELAALAAASAGDASGGAAAAAAGRQGGVLWSFMQHVVTMLVNRLQLTVRNVTVEFEVRAGHMCARVVLAVHRRSTAVGCCVHRETAVRRGSARLTAVRFGAAVSCMQSLRPRSVARQGRAAH